MIRPAKPLAAWSGTVVLLGSLFTWSFAYATTPPVNQRFASSDVAEVPDFQRHVAPLLGRLGCNGRSCHGSFQGRGDLRLSLFGYDFQMDYAALVSEASSTDGKRIDRDAPENSLILKKPSLQLDHEGGARFELGSWEHHLLRRWIAAAAQGTPKPQELSALAIEPAEVVFAGAKQTPGGSVPLRVIAVWDDGQREDVTPLCRFRSNDDSVVTVNREGQLTAAGPGDTHVIAFYDNGVAAVPVMQPFPAPQSKPLAPVAQRGALDQAVVDKLHKLNIVPSALCSDSEFLRRVSIDITGTLPSPGEVEAFLVDTTTDKRDRKVDELLKRPAYAAWWTNKLCDFTGCNPNQQAELGQETSVQWYRWIYARLRDNVPYDQLVRDIVLATGRREGQSYEEYAREVSSFFREEDPVDFAARKTMPHYWTRRSMREPAQAAEAFAHNFLGIRLQCAQCHKHPFAPWTQEDYQAFSLFFENVRFGVAPSSQARYGELAKEVGLPVRGNDGAPIRDDVLRKAKNGETVPWRELYIAPTAQTQTRSLLRSGMVSIDSTEDPRQPIMEWMNAPENPWFARAFVNRVWAGYFHTGIIHPPDDLNPANPASNPQLLEFLTLGFIENDYDMKWLHRTITTSQTYQRSWRPSENNASDQVNFSRAIPRRLPAEVVYDAVKQALAAREHLDSVRTDLTRRASGHLSMRLAGTYAMQVFGKPARAVNCDCERDNGPTLLQSVFLQNDPLMEQRLEGSGWVAENQHAAPAQIPQLVREAWLRTLSRPPEADERARATKHLEDADSVADGLRDLLWALLNTKEFLLNK